jgi:signal transduction histidine kinase
VNAVRRRRFGTRQLAFVLVLLFLALALPSAVLVAQALTQIRWEAYHQYRLLADELATRIDGDLRRAIATEEARSGDDYRFLVVTDGAANATALQRSPLARLPVESPVPGVIGYFQVDADGTLSTPLLPDAADLPAAQLDAAEWARRRALADAMLDVLTRNALLPRGDAPPRAAAGGGDATPSDAKADAERQVQQAFAELNAADARGNLSQRRKLGRLDELDLDTTYQRKAVPQQVAPNAFQPDKGTVRAKRKEQSAVLADAAGRDAPSAPRVRIFESEIDPFDFTLLDSGHGVLYRTVWRDGRRTIQGALLDQRRFVDGAIAAPFRASPLASMSRLLVAYRGDVIDVVSAAGPTQPATDQGRARELLHQVRLSAPLGDFQLLWGIERMPPGPGARVIVWSGLVLAGVLVVGLFALYRLGRRQLALAQQQRDFVSAVSHELKTPLTSIRMYAEMLREGWVGADKRREYYGFIHDESERLSRLIANVLQLARLERSELDLKRVPTGAAALMDTLRARLASQIERAGFAATFAVAPDVAAREVVVDVDAVVQIVINLVDNALKFAAKAERKAVDVGLRARGAAALELSVRDYGPGVPKDEMRRVFELFYRTGSELTRETVGTGIGLALVRELARAMGGDVDVVDREPGAEFRVTLPVARQGTV